ncbi:cysteine-rich KTR domain-containing protein [Tyzzerella sp. OttesenSCG-928-J15]|nr:cysteine-rich KTR domain-containing protein [Tyzzerella sp. OttesenSCG-928-J15]
MTGAKWIFCPICGNKTHTKIRGDTELKNFPLFCPKCKKESLINAKQLNITQSREPDAQTQSR